MRAELTLAAARAINRVLGDYPKACARLAPHAGKRCRFEMPPLAVELRVTPAGRVEPVGAGAEGEPDLVFEIPASALPALARDRDAGMQRARFTGDGELAQLVAELARELRWDAEEDLSRWIGDPAAHRVAGGARQFAAWQRDARARLIDNAAEYLAEEHRAFIRKEELESLARRVEDLRDAAARLEARLHNLIERTP